MTFIFSVLSFDATKNKTYPKIHEDEKFYFFNRKTVKAMKIIDSFSSLSLKDTKILLLKFFDWKKEFHLKARKQSL